MCARVDLDLFSFASLILWEQYWNGRKGVNMMPEGTLKTSEEIQRLKTIAGYAANNAECGKAGRDLAKEADGIISTLEWLQGDEANLEEILGDLSVVYEDEGKKQP